MCKVLQNIDSMSFRLQRTERKQYMAIVAKSASGTAVFSDITDSMYENQLTRQFAAKQTVSDDLHSACIILMEELILKIFRMGKAVHLSLLEVGFRLRDIPIEWVSLGFLQLSWNWRRMPGPYLAGFAAS